MACLKLRREVSCRVYIMRSAAAGNASGKDAPDGPMMEETHSYRLSPLGPALQLVGGSREISASSFWMRFAAELIDEPFDIVTLCRFDAEFNRACGRSAGKDASLQTECGAGRKRLFQKTKTWPTPPFFTLRSYEISILFRGREGLLYEKYVMSRRRAARLRPSMGCVPVKLAS